MTTNNVTAKIAQLLMHIHFLYSFYLVPNQTIPPGGAARPWALIFMESIRLGKPVAALQTGCRVPGPLYQPQVAESRVDA